MLGSVATCLGVRLLCNSLRQRGPAYVVAGEVANSGSPSQPKIRVKVACGFGIAQVVIALTCVGLGIYIKTTLGEYFWQADACTPAWLGGFVLLTGFLNLLAAANKNNYSLISAAKVFDILSVIGSGIGGLFFTIGYFYYENCVENLFDKEYEYPTKSNVACLIKTDTGKIYFGLMVILAVIEFFVALFASIFISPGCCRGTNRAVIFAQPQQGQVITSTHTSMMVQQPGGCPQTPYHPHIQYSHQVNNGTRPIYNPPAHSSVNSTNLAYMHQPTHDRSMLISGDGHEMSPPPYSMHQ
ncbi:uncharacterized protein LOC130614531 [Hydractinia symbiolongicarpus]|uniref:uncharacterized protein LOC130614531 n=1 Tax=Hydractinia symbiolongicarpus TaxID=13093 RepID=UPI0025515C15|nr:uncharacterized protein LOC130614531 [Hydractinia symbiolongicarpus]